MTRVVTFPSKINYNGGNRHLGKISSGSGLSSRCSTGKPLFENNMVSLPGVNVKNKTAVMVTSILSNFQF